MTKIARRLSIGAIAVGVVLGAGIVVQRMNRTARGLDGLRAELSKLERQEPTRSVIVHEVRRESEPAPTPVPLSSTAPAGDASDTDDLLPEEKEHQLEVINDARLESCKRTYGGEALDPEWSGSALRIMRERFATLDLSALRISAECRTTLCRVDFSYSDAASGLRAVEQLVKTNPWAGQSLTRLNQETKEGVSYLSREGLELPGVDVASLEY
jgi:hypothetical protein